MKSKKIVAQSSFIWIFDLLLETLDINRENVIYWWAKPPPSSTNLTLVFHKYLKGSDKLNPRQYWTESQIFSSINTLVVLVKVFDLLCSESANIYPTQWKKKWAIAWALYIHRQCD